MPEHDIGIVVLSNEDFVSARMTSIIADYLYSELLQNTSIKPRISKRLADLKGKLAGLEPNLTQQSQKLHARKWLLSLGKAEYIGEYEHPLLGSIWVSESQSGHFELRFGKMKSDSLGMNEPDKIRVELMPNSGEVISFSITDKVEGLIYNSLLYEKVQ